MQGRAILFAGLLLGCGGGGGGGPRFREEGACVPPQGTTEVRRVPAPAGVALSCLRGGQSVRVLRSAAEYRAAMEADCVGDPDSVDFSAVMAIVIQGHTGQFNELRHLYEDGSSLYLSLYHAARGSPPPDLILWVPRSDKQLRVGDCVAVCERNCDQPIP